MRFKVGQTVKLIDNNCMTASVGATARVTRLDKEYLQVTWITGHTKVSYGDVYSQMDGDYNYEQFVPALEVGEQLLFNFMLEKDYAV